MVDADIVIDPADCDLDDASREWLDSDDAEPTNRRNVEIFTDFAGREPEGKQKRIVMRFLRSPSRSRATAGSSGSSSASTSSRRTTRARSAPATRASARPSTAASSCARSATAASASRACPSTMAAGRSPTRRAGSRSGDGRAGPGPVRRRLDQARPERRDRHEQEGRPGDGRPHLRGPRGRQDPRARRRRRADRVAARRARARPRRVDRLGADRQRRAGGAASPTAGRGSSSCGSRTCSRPPPRARRSPASRRVADLAEIQRLIAAALPGAEVEVVDEGGGDHLRAIVAAPQFAGPQPHRPAPDGPRPGPAPDGRRLDPRAVDRDDGALGHGRPFRVTGWTSMPATFEVPVHPLPPERFRPLLGDDYGQVEAGDRAGPGPARWADDLAHQLDRPRRRGGRAAAIAPRLRLRRRRERALDRRHGRAGVLRDHQAHPQPPARLRGRRRRARRRERAVYEQTARAATRPSFAEHGRARRRRHPATTRRPPGSSARSASRRAAVVWRCHVGVDEPNEASREAWGFLRPYVEQADALVFSRERVRLGGPRPRPRLDHPAVDRRLLAEEPGARRRDVAAILARRRAHRRRPRLGRRRRSRARTAAPAASTPAPRSIRTRRSRRDDRSCSGLALGRLKDPLGVMRASPSTSRRARRAPGARRARPSSAVADDPEGAEVLAEVRAACASRSPPTARGARAPRLAADGRRRGERGDRQRAPAPRDDRRPEEPRRGLRPDRRRGDVEGAAGGRERASAASRTRSSTARAASWSIRATSTRSRRRSAACWTRRSGGLSSARLLASGSARSSSAPPGCCATSGSSSG